MMKRISHFLLGTLRGRLIIGVATVHAVMMALFIGDLTVRQRAMLLDRQVEEATGLSQTLAISAAGWIAARDISGLQEIVEAQRRYPEVIFVMLADQEGRVLADTNQAGQGLYMLDLPREVAPTLLSRTPALVDIAVPAMIGGRHVGWARVGLGQKAAGEKLAEITRNGVAYALAAILIGSLIAWLMGHRITRRLYAVQETIYAVRAGNRLARSSLVGTDEPAIMAREFNSMLDALAERVMLAELSADIGCALTKEGDLRGILNACAEALVRHLDVAFARIWTVNVAEDVLELQASAGMYTRIDGSHSRVPVGKFKIGLIASEREPHVTNAVIGDPLVHDQEWAEREGMVAFAGHPLTIEDKLVGVMAMFARNPLTEVTLKALAAVSNEIAIGIERKLGEEGLRRLNRELRALSNCNQVLVRAEDEQTLLNEICRIICDEAGYRMAWVGYAENDAAKSVRPVAWAGNEDGYLENADITWADTDRGRGPIGHAIRSGESVCIQDFVTDPQTVPWRESALQRGYRASIALPLKDAGENTLGVLCIYSTEPNSFTVDEIRLLEELAGDLAFGIMVLRARLEQQGAEESLRESEARLKEAQRIAHMGHWELDLQKNVLSWSDEVYRMFGLEPQEFGATYEAFLEHVHPDDRELVNRAYAESVQARTGYDIEHRILLKSGETRYVNDRCVTEYDETGTPLRSLGTVLDITERKEASEELTLLNQELDQRVKLRTAELEEKNAELERVNQLFTGRELRMVELKEKIRQLEKESSA